MKWEKEKENLEKLILEKKSYEEIGRMYNCTGANIKKVAKILGIPLEPRRVISSSENFNKKERATGICQNCGKTIFIYPSSKGKYCSRFCQNEKQYKDYIEKWKNGKISGNTNHFEPSAYVRRYIFEKNDCKCEVCKQNYINPYTGRSILQIHHKNGNCLDNSEENLALLCPNHHAMTENFGSRNKNGNKERTKYVKKDK